MLYVFLGLIVLALVTTAVLYNGLVTARNQVRNLWRQIDVQLKRRYDLIPNLVQAVRDAMSFEQETLQKVVDARGRAVKAAGPADKASADSAVTQALGGLYAVMEQYPELKSHENIRQLQGELGSTENALASARSNYNHAVRDYQNLRETVPSNFVAGFFQFAPEDYYEAAEADRAVPKVALR